MSESLILREYLEQRASYEALAKAVQARLTGLAQADAAIHSISHRLKTRESLERKLGRPEAIYRSLRDVTDVIGFRVVTFFEDATYELAARIEASFRVDLEHSLDKRRALEPTQFGYRSLHYVCALPDAPDDAPRFEIQLRTLLQHAWAEIEHDLGYKSPAAIPSSMRRRFSRLASLLELADDEFLAIRRELGAYEREVRSQSPEALRKLAVDRVSMEAFAAADPSAALDGEIARRLGLPLEDRLFYPDYLIRMLAHVGLTRVDALERELRARRDELLAFVPHYLRFAQETWQMSSRDFGHVFRGYCWVFLAHLVLLGSKALELDKVGKVAEFFRTVDSNDEATARRVALRLLEADRAYRAEGPAGGRVPAADAKG